MTRDPVIPAAERSLTVRAFAPGVSAIRGDTRRRRARQLACVPAIVVSLSACDASSGWSGGATFLGAFVFAIVWMVVTSGIDKNIGAGRKPIELAHLSPGAAGLLRCNKLLVPTIFLAMLVDLEHRGIIVARAHPHTPHDHVFEWREHGPRLRPAEQKLMAAVFRDGPVADLSSIQRTLTVATMRSIRLDLREELRSRGLGYGPVMRALGVALVTLLFAVILGVMWWIAPFLPEDAHGLHYAAMLIAGAGLLIPAFRLLPIGISRAGTEARDRLRRLSMTGDVPASFLVVRDPLAELSQEPPSGVSYAHWAYVDRWTRALRHNTNLANPHRVHYSG